ncbi:hypothetical protein LIER_08105 [Lithospermum erythrorhizon]|uniref:Late embryogenesis abundant protein LEA-2 subgroup domain-containing protein n=1 Tax=Lithospermum erythrorhizon TaxID=34254 RepID=A0AAV3PAS3_LITER
MADHQRIHPMVSIEMGKPAYSRPLMPHQAALLRSDKGNLVQHQPPLRQHTVPAIPSQPPPKRRNSCWCRCVCWTISLLILLLIIIAAIAGILFLVFKPKLPDYSVNNLRISELRLNLDLSLYARFNVKITAENPNEKIGIYYEKGSQISVWYKSTNLCHGPLPKFYQGHQNKTVMDVALTGQSQYGRTLMTALQEEQQTGRIPLDLKINVPVRIKLGALKLPKVRVLGDCMVVVDSLSTDNVISIKSSTCKFRLKL